jgi:hypothetical protein
MVRRAFYTVVGLVALAALVGTPAFGAEDDFGSDALLPVPGLLRPKPRPTVSADKRVTRRGACEGQPLPALSERLPFGPGEITTYEVLALGIRTGRVHMRVGERAQMDGSSVYPLQASAKTSGFVSILGELDGRMVSFLDPRSLVPVRMANRFVIDTVMQPPLLAREDAAFSTDAQVAARLTYEQSGKARTKPAKLRSTSDLLDVLSVVYYMRSRELTIGSRYCFEIYHRRRLWRVEGGVGTDKLIRSPFTTRPAREVWGDLSLVGKNDKEPRRVTAWVSVDDDRLPLLVETPDRFGKLQVALSGWAPGRRLVRTE